jgi:competence ComEA-like helix-hairpin-helix protein
MDSPDAARIRPANHEEIPMNKVYPMLQALALSMLLLAGGAHAAAKSAPGGKAAVAVASNATHERSSHAKPMMKVNINTADADAIRQALINIGPSKAAAIVAYRKQHGAFRSADQLAEVKGVGLKTVEKNRDRIVVGGAAPASSAKR